MTKSRTLFGTDGIRGIAGKKPLDPESLVRIGKAIAHIFITHRKGRHRILIGKDTRLSGYMIENALCAGITSMGVDVQLVGPITTPGVAYLTWSMRSDAGIMISASHNPYEDNGIKIFGNDGKKLPDQLEADIEKLVSMLEDSSDGLQGSGIGKAHRIDDAAGRYTVYLKNSFPPSLTLEGMRLGFDCANGAGYIVAPQTCEELGADVVSRGISPNGRNINAGFGSLYPEVVRELVLEQNLNLGISLDGDGDRAIFCDEKGNIVDGDKVLALCAIDLKERGKLEGNTVVATIMSNLGLEVFLQDHGISLIRTAVGDRYVREKMEEIGACLGGEQSGHTIFSHHATTGDGILSALQVLAVMQRKQKPLSELLESFVAFPQKTINVKVAAKPALETIDGLLDMIEKKEAELKNRGRILVRYSGTESKARVMVECDDEDMCKKHAHDVAALLEKRIGAV